MTDRLACYLLLVTFCGLTGLLLKILSLPYLPPSLHCSLPSLHPFLLQGPETVTGTGWKPKAFCKICLASLPQGSFLPAFRVFMTTLIVRLSGLGEFMLSYPDPKTTRSLLLKWIILFTLKNLTIEINPKSWWSENSCSRWEMSNSCFRYTLTVQIPCRMEALSSLPAPIHCHQIAEGRESGSSGKAREELVCTRWPSLHESLTNGRKLHGKSIQRSSL